MSKRVMYCCSITVLCLVLAAGMASAQDTSPYLAGAWNGDFYGISIINPTTKWLDVYAVAYSEGSPVFCGMMPIAPNGTLSEGGFIPNGYDVEFGTIKFFAFPQGTMKFDPNAIIGGFQYKSWWDVIDGPNVESNLKAVTINNYTIREFSMIPPRTDPCWNSPS
jgi:hypothetical protein